MFDLHHFTSLLFLYLHLLSSESPWHNVKNVVEAEHQSFNLTNEPLELGTALKIEIQHKDIDKILQEFLVCNYTIINIPMLENFHFTTSRSILVNSTRGNYVY